jgi:hypothetical protein
MSVDLYSSNEEESDEWSVAPLRLAEKISQLGDAIHLLSEEINRLRRDLKKCKVINIYAE